MGQGVREGAEADTRDIRPAVQARRNYLPGL
jgi:hypothetical protein